MSPTDGFAPRAWHLPRVGRHAQGITRRTLVGRQGIFSADRALLGHEFFYRAPGRLGLRVDLWNSAQQDRATEHVIRAVFTGGDSPAAGVPAYVNFTRSYLLDQELPMPPAADVVIEVVESAHADQALYNRLAYLKALGYRIAVDDYVGTRSQRELLALADVVKVDLRDLESPDIDLEAIASGPGPALLAERIETRDDFARCRDLGFTMFQGFFMEPPIVVERPSLAEVSGS